MKGHVNSDLEAILELKFQDKNGQEQLIEVTIDTGFNGYLTLPSKIIQQLNSSYLGQIRSTLADGNSGVFDIYQVALQWDNQLKQVEVDVMECIPLIGMALLKNYQLQISVVVGGEVSIIPLP